jgi:oxygen-independent coproporphyrinogen-3 oxidase
MQQSVANPIGLYFSIPFCRSKCTYCNFASGVYPASEHARYSARLMEDLAAAPGFARDHGLELPTQVDTIYFGGGTPVLLEAEHFRGIFHAIREQFELLPGAEITVEAAPGQLSDGTMAAMVECGVNRISFGVQSFIDREAQQSGRLHTRADVFEDVRRLRAAGITNLNLDLLAGLAGQTLDSWRESLGVLLETGVPHASVYMLEIDEDSRLGRELIAGGARYGAELVPSDDTIAQMYEEAVETLEGAGVVQYEISNFARPGFESKHNLRYWQRRPYLGLGLDASSMLTADDGTVLRSTTTSDLNEYLSEASASAETAWLGPVQQLEEAWFLGLRRNAGVSIAALEAEFGVEAVAPSAGVAERLASDGLLQMEPVLIEPERRKTARTATAARAAKRSGAGRGSADGVGDGVVDRLVRLTPRGRLISNELFAEFLGLAPVPELASSRHE